MGHDTVRCCQDPILNLQVFPREMIDWPKNIAPKSQTLGGEVVGDAFRPPGGLTGPTNNLDIDYQQPRKEAMITDSQGTSQDFVNTDSIMGDQNRAVSRTRVRKSR